MVGTWDILVISIGLHTHLTQSMQEHRLTYLNHELPACVCIEKMLLVIVFSL